MTTLFKLPVLNLQHPPSLPSVQRFGSSVPANDFRTFSRAYMKNEIVFSAIEMLATSAGEPHIVGRRWRRNSPQIRNEIRNEEQRLLSCGLPRREVKASMIRNGFFLDLPAHPLIQLLDNPNPWMSRGQQWGTVVMDMSLAGNAYILKARRQKGLLKGTVGELWRLRPDRVRIIPSQTKHISHYEYGEGNEKIEFPAEDIIHFKTRHPLDDYYGMPPLMAISGRVDIDEYMKIFLRQFFERGGTGPGSILTVKQSLTTENKEAISKRFGRQFGQQGGYHELMILDNTESSYQPLGLDRGLRDALPTEIDAMQEARIAMVFGVPNSILGTRIGQESSSYANRKQDWEVFWKLTMTPKLSDLDDTLNRQLVPEFGGIDEVLFDLSDIEALREDTDKMHERVNKDVAGGLMSFEEGREAIGLDPDIKEGILLIPRLSTPTPVDLLGKVVLADAAEKAKEASDDGDDDGDDDDDAPAGPEATDMIDIVRHTCGKKIATEVFGNPGLYCSKCKVTFKPRDPEPWTVIKTVERDEDGKVARVVERRSS